MSRWYIIHAYSGFENKVRDAIQSEATRLGLTPFVEQIEVPTETITEHPTKPVGMSGSDPERTRLGTQETSGRPLAGAPQDTTASGEADTGMVGSETENPGPGRDTRRTDPDPAAASGADDPETTTAMSDDDPDRTRLGSHQTGHPRQ